MEPVIILVQPEYPDNIGLVCRVIKNFGSKTLLIVQPKTALVSAQSKSRAMHASDILESAQVFSCLEDALSCVDYAVATTAQTGSGKKALRTACSPTELAQQFAGSNARIGIVFGRESTGLTNAEIRRCDFVVHIPTAHAYPTLNISHACAIVLYALHSARVKSTFKTAPPAHKKILMKKITRFIKITPSLKNKNAVLSASKALVSRSLITAKEVNALLALIQAMEQEAAFPPERETNNNPDCA